MFYNLDLVVIFEKPFIIVICHTPTNLTNMSRFTRGMRLTLKVEVKKHYSCCLVAMSMYVMHVSDGADCCTHWSRSVEVF